MEQRLDQLQIELDKLEAQQGQLLQVQQIQQLAQGLFRGKEKLRQTIENLLKRQEEEQEMLKQSLDHLNIIQNQVQVLMTHSYELHEYPVPRLFIVLPKTVGFREKQFRLYFLCECGTHTMPDDCKTSHEIHLAKHDGYDLDKPTEFFERYGTYLLAMMYMIKYGIVAAGLIMPPLAYLKIADELVEGQKHVENLKKNITPLVNSTINYLQEIRMNTEAGAELTADRAEFVRLEALEGADLRQLMSYLKDEDQGRVLGNLYRIITLEGHVKWVCFDHYCSVYGDQPIQLLRDVVETNSGRVIEEAGKVEVEIEIASTILARQFCNAIVRACRIQELRITLEWDATKSELQEIADAITKASVTHLIVNGIHLKGGSTTSFDPILQLVSNGQIQSLQLKNFDGFFSRVSQSAMAPAPNFRMFSMDSEILSKDKAFRMFNGFLEHCPALTTLELKLHVQYSLAKAIPDVLRKLHNLQSLKVDGAGVSITATISQGTTQDMTMTIKQLGGINTDDFEFIKKGDHTQLAIQHTPQEADDGRLVDILRHSPKLNHLQIGCQEERCLAITDLVVSTRSTAVQEGMSSLLRTFELMEENLVVFDEVGAVDDKTHIQSHLSFTEDSTEFNMHTWVRLQNQKQITVRHPVCHFIHQYGWSIVFLNGPWTLGDHLATTLASIISRRGSRLKRFDLDPSSLTPPGFHGLERIMKRSQGSVAFRLFLSNLEKKGQVEKVNLLFARHGWMLDGLEMCSRSPERWLPRISSSFPTRSSFPKLTSFELRLLPNSYCPPSCVPWIVTMVSPPPQVLLYSMHSQPSSHDVGNERTIDSGSETTESWTALRKIALCNISFQYEDWKAVIEAIDFTELQHLDFWRSNISQELLKLLVGRILDNTVSKSPFKTLRVNTGFTKDVRLLRMLADIRKRALVTIIEK